MALDFVGRAVHRHSHPYCSLDISLPEVHEPELDEVPSAECAP
eukprot:CAMPEP_0115717512 /NCGR_PEP_ID=MMETSP0272-20121206/76911_1 /TAXON_ID=71861 /ORGANISM="Scrippsiella trochoidea, Strain CCMP3099" /LENGTH=42 /DNA_ID= /DNA_START= /DNA_END= /DNA_ORIENTATION=